MRPPIIVNEHGDVQVFETVRDVEMALEAIDIRNDEYTAYDADGQLLVLAAVDADEKVRLIGGEHPVDRSRELKTVLSVFLMRTGESDEVEEMSIPQLIDRYVAKHGFSR